MGSKLEQSAHPTSYHKAKTILRNNFRREWPQRLDIGTEDSIHQLDRAAQVTIFRLRTGHCQLLSHLHRLKISHLDKCPCGTGPQTPTTSCSPAPPSTLWDASLVDAHRKLWGPVDTLRQTADFALLTRLKTGWEHRRKTRRTEESQLCLYTVDIMTAEHTLHHPQLHNTVRRTTWPGSTPLRVKLHSHKENLRSATAFVHLQQDNNKEGCSSLLDMDIAYQIQT